MTQPARDSEDRDAPLAEWPRELDGDFEIKGLAGRGGMAIVFRARDRVRGRDVAVKVFRPRVPGDVEAMARIVRKASALTKLHHPNIVRVIDMRRLVEDNIALVMQPAPGRSLKAELAKGPVDPARAERILRDVASALEHAHLSGVVHGDVKPENIFIHDASGKAMLADFGVARVRDAPAEVTANGTTIGTPRYMAPEQFAGISGDPRSDLYSLGIVAWEMLSGKRAWAGESLRNVIHRQKLDSLPPLDQYRDDLPPRLQYLIEGLMQKKPDQRWSSAGLFLSMLSSSSAPPGLHRWVEAQEMRRRKTAVVAPVSAVQETVVEKPPEPVEVRKNAAVSRRLGTDRAGKRKGPRVSPPPEHLPLGVKVGITAAVILGALVVTFGLPSRGGSAANAVASNGSDSNVSSDNASAAGATLASSPNPGDARLPRSQSFRSARGEQGSPGTLTSTGSITSNDVVSGNTAPGGGRRALGDTAAAIESLFNQLTREDSLILAAEGSRVDAAASRSVRVTPPAAGNPRTVFAPPTRSLGPSIDFPREASTIAAGMRHSCMLDPNGRAICWGNNQFGQLGDGTVEAHESPVLVAPGHLFAHISAGSWHTCGLTGEGELSCWGRNESGQLGDGTTIGRGTPARVNGAGSYRAVQAGDTHTCAITFDDALRCWGSNAFGELGDGTQQSRTTPIPVRLPGPVRAVAAGVHHTCALLSDGSAYCWGRNHAGQLGNGTSVDVASPVPVAGGARFVSIAAGSAHTCAIALSGRAWCWGENISGQLGAGPAVVVSIRPLPLEVTTPFRSVVAGLSHTCARARDNRVWCWGRNAFGQLGNGTTVNQARPMLASGINGVIGLNATGSHTCGVAASGDAFCWGENADGQLGAGNRENAAVPVKVRSPR